MGDVRCGVVVVAVVEGVSRFHRQIYQNKSPKEEMFAALMEIHIHPGPPLSLLPSREGQEDLTDSISSTPSAFCSFAFLDFALLLSFSCSHSSSPSDRQRRSGPMSDGISMETSLAIQKCIWCY